jgi:hypothetical protein
MTIEIMLSEAQVAALKMAGKDDVEVVESMIQAAAKARVKGIFTAFRAAEEKVNTEIYDNSSRRGAKWPVDKDTFLKQASKDSAAIYAKL